MQGCLEAGYLANLSVYVVRGKKVALLEMSQFYDEVIPPTSLQFST